MLHGARVQLHKIRNLAAKFKLGEQSRQKADPADPSKDASGHSLFRSDDFLTVNQVASYFSHLAVKKKAFPTMMTIDLMTSRTRQMKHNLNLKSSINKLCVNWDPSTHPIAYSAYNLCDMSSSSKLKKFTIPILKKICAFFDIDTADVSVSRKKLYVEKIKSLRLACTCRQ